MSIYEINTVHKVFFWGSSYTIICMPSWVAWSKRFIFLAISRMKRYDGRWENSSIEGNIARELPSTYSSLIKVSFAPEILPRLWTRPAAWAFYPMPSWSGTPFISPISSPAFEEKAILSLMNIWPGFHQCCANTWLWTGRMILPDGGGNRCRSSKMWKKEGLSAYTIMRTIR